MRVNNIFVALALSWSVGLHAWQGQQPRQKQQLQQQQVFQERFRPIVFLSIGYAMTVTERGQSSPRIKEGKFVPTGSADKQNRD